MLFSYFRRISFYMNICRFLFTLLFSITFFSNAQELKQLNAAEIKLGLQKLNVVGSVLYIAAHPDDENTRLLAYLAKERKFRTGYLSLTRGDGGQNLIGTEQAELLGVIRTQELLAARKVDGAEQFFTRANDFGFSKTSDEALKLWGKEQILEDMVWVIRNFKPDVIITRFPEDARAGHGQHAASAILAREAFFAAADAKRFPHQLKVVKPWQAKRILWNTYNFGGNNTTSNDQLKINVGLYNALLGKSYGEISAESRTNHKSQGFGTANQRGDFTEFFSHVAGNETKTDLFEGINTDWNRITKTKELSGLITKCEEEFDSSDPSKSVEKLLAIKSLIDKTDLRYKSAEVDALLLACTGVWFEMNSEEPQYAAGETVPVKLQAIARIPKNFKYSISISESLSNQKNIVLEPNKFNTINATVLFPEQQTSQPYWLDNDHTIGTYTIQNQDNVGLPENKLPFSGRFSIKIGDQTINTTQPIIYKFTDPVRGEVVQPIVIAPPVTAKLSEKGYIFTSNEPKKIIVQLQSFRDNSSGMLHAQVPAGWKISPESLSFNLSKKGNIQTKEFIITPNGGVPSGKLSIKVTIDNKSYNQGIKEIKYDHIPAQTLFPTAEARLEKLDLKTTGKTIAYISGAGDLVAESLKQIGYKVSILTTEQALNTNLSGFDAVITGVRLYNIDPQVKLLQPKLLQYVSNGGILLVQYNVSNPLQLENIGPYPFKLSRNRVTEEDSEVRFVTPNHQLLNHPNKITQKDFEGWVQERGLYFTTEADKAFTHILSMNDTNESAKEGALLVADYGKGRFVYTSLSFFRQLPAGVPGAYRLFVNLISR